MDKLEYVIPKYTTAGDIKRARKQIGLNQQEFADMLGCSKPTIARWETDKGHITGPIAFVVYSILYTMNSDQMILPEQQCALRLIYMYKQDICTLIDVDDVNRNLHIVNYASNFMFKAFGNNDSPSYKDYEDFLESRCFPKNRDKMKIELDALDLPFYDPIMIIEKTEGRMAEDDFWIKIERL